MFDDEFLSSIPENTFEALKSILNHFGALGGIESFEGEHYDDYIRAYAFLQVFSETHNLNLKFGDLDKIQREDHIAYICKAFLEHTVPIYQELEANHRKRIFEDSKTQYSLKIGTSFAYEFTEGDLKKIQKNINELRTLISDSKIIEKAHQQRLLKRLERLQSELHKRVSDLDRFWGFVGDAGIVMGKFGKDAKPMVDRIREMMGIVWRTQSKAEELESGSTNLFLSEGEKEE
jgi:hypothetical protein